MAGIGHRGFMGRNAGAGGFRYLHSEVANGLNSWGNILSSSSYFGNCLAVSDLIDNYGFVDNYLDLDGIDASYGSNQFIRVLYNQIGSSNLTGDGKWLKSDNFCTWFGDGVNGNNNTSVFDNQRLNDPKTYVMVLRRTTSVPTVLEILFSIRDGNGSILNLRQAVGGGINIFCRAGSVTESTPNVIEFGSFTSTNTSLLIITHDGSGTGFKMYINDMTTEKPITSTTTGSPTNSDILNDYYLGAISGLEFEGYMPEFHEFMGVLNQASRETVKEIFEQKYTFL